MSAKLVAKATAVYSTTTGGAITPFRWQVDGKRKLIEGAQRKCQSVERRQTTKAVDLVHGTEDLLDHFRDPGSNG